MTDPVSPRRSDMVTQKDSEPLSSPRKRGGGHAEGVTDVSPRQSERVAQKDSEPLSSPRKRGGMAVQGQPASPRSSKVETTTPRRSLPASQAVQSPRHSGAKEALGSPRKEAREAAVPKKGVTVPKLNLKMRVKPSPRGEVGEASKDPMHSFVASLGAPKAAAAFEVASAAAGVGPNQRRQSVPKLALQELPKSESTSSASTYTQDKAGDESSTSSSTEDGPEPEQTGGANEEGYCSCSSEGFGRESPASAGSPSFAPAPGTALKVPPLKMSGVFGPRGITPSFGAPSTKMTLQGKQSPRRLLSARSEEDTGTARKLSHRLQNCEFHQMNDSTDCEYHKLASSDSDSCATQSEEESEVRPST